MLASQRTTHEMPLENLMFLRCDNARGTLTISVTDGQYRTASDGQSESIDGYRQKGGDLAPANRRLQADGDRLYRAKLPNRPVRCGKTIDDRWGVLSGD
jgi:hypothetical protein